MKTFIILIIFIIPPAIHAQESSGYFRKVRVNKKVNEFPDTFNLSSPLQTHLTIQYNSIKSLPDFWPKVNVARNRWDNPVYSFTEETKQQILNTRIVEVNYFRDSVAVIISQRNDSLYDNRWYEFDGKSWYHAGQDQFRSYENAYDQFHEAADFVYKNLLHENWLATIPKDTVTFINYLQKHSMDPQKMVLQSLAKHKLVAYGEIHRRQVSWDFCRNLVKDMEFIKTTGTVFMEISAHSQIYINEFLASPKINKELILATFRDMTENGWNDKGMYDFILDIWKVNQKLPVEERIKIIAVDIPRPWSQIINREDIDRKINRVHRDSFMAKTILEFLANKKDPRNAFFIVGSGHLCKTINSAGAIIANQLPRNDFYSYFTHCPRISNDGFIPGKIRKGVFDYAFGRNGNKPVALSLAGSPFGKEPFDGLVGTGKGTYEANYDGYIFFGPLDQEQNGKTLFELYDETFIKELDRRYRLFGSSLKEAWKLEEDTREGIIKLVNKNTSKFRWSNL